MLQTRSTLTTGLPYTVPLTHTLVGEAESDTLVVQTVAALLHAFVREAPPASLPPVAMQVCPLFVEWDVHATVLTLAALPQEAWQQHGLALKALSSIFRTFTGVPPESFSEGVDVGQQQENESSTSLSAEEYWTAQQIRRAARGVNIEGAKFAVTTVIEAAQQSEPTKSFTDTISLHTHAQIHVLALPGVPHTVALTATHLAMMQLQDKALRPEVGSLKHRCLPNCWSCCPLCACVTNRCNCTFRKRWPGHHSCKR